MDIYYQVRRKAVEFARMERDAKVRAEKGNIFRGKRIRDYQRSVGMGEDNYCVAFVYWCYQQACAALGKYNLIPKTARTHVLWHESPYDWVLPVGESPQPGDIWIRTDKPHVGLVREAINGRGEVATIEGNTWRKEWIEIVDGKSYKFHDWGVHGRIRNMTTNTLAILRPTWMADI